MGCVLLIAGIVLACSDHGILGAICIVVALLAPPISVEFRK